VPPIPTRATLACPASDGFLVEQAVADLRALDVGRGVQALGAASAPFRQCAADLVRVRRGVDPRGASHGAHENAVEPAPWPEEPRDLPGVAPVTHGHDRAVVQAPLEVLRGTSGHRLALRLRIRPRRADDRVGQMEDRAERIFELEVQPRRDLDADLHHAALSGLHQQALDFRA
jgi:hypothetical protein